MAVSESKPATEPARPGFGWGRTLGLLLLLAVVVTLVEPTGIIRGRVRGEPFFAGRPASFWVRRMESTDPTIQSAALERLANGGKASIVVLRRMLKHSDAGIRGQAAQLLGKIGADARGAASDLIELLRDGDLHVRRVTALALPQVDAEPKLAVAALHDLCKKEPSVEVSRALSKYGPMAAPALETLMKVMEDKSLPTEVRWNAVRTIGKIREPAVPAIDRLIVLLKDKEDTIREHAAEALGDIGPLAERSVDHLVPLLNDPHTRVRRDAVRSLGQIGGKAKTKLEAIRKLTKDKKELVQKAAKDAIKALTK